MSEKTILKLQLPTDPLWVKNVVESNIEELLTDHAFCEQKAASDAITLIVQNPNLSDLVQEMALLVQEEMDHFKRVHDIILARGFILGKERKDDYVNELRKFIISGGSRAEQQARHGVAVMGWAHLAAEQENAHRHHQAKLNHQGQNNGFGQSCAWM